jgi:hypothetical protein
MIFDGGVMEWGFQLTEHVNSFSRSRPRLSGSMALALEELTLPEVIDFACVAVEVSAWLCAKKMLWRLGYDLQR